jgi:hypothetical protein
MRLAIVSLLGTELKFEFVPRDMLTTRMLYAAWCDSTHCKPAVSGSTRGVGSLSVVSTRTPIRSVPVATPMLGLVEAAMPETWVPWPSPAGS